MTTQVAVRLDDVALEQLDWLVARTSFETRADVIRSAIETLACRERDREIDACLTEAYTRLPQTADEQSWSRANDWSSLGDDDWSALR